MKLLIATPSAIVADYADVASVRAEDESGEFGILPHHADFVTALSTSVVGWRRTDGRQGYCAVRGGLLTVRGGQEVAIATREAIPGDDLDALEARVRERQKGETESEQLARSHAEQLQVNAIRQIIGYLRPDSDRSGGAQG